MSRRDVVPDIHLKSKLRATLASVVVGIFLLTLKFAAWALTGSAAVLSDAAGSVINVAASIFAYASVRIAAEPPDEDHPYGHGKIEYFSAGFEGGLIVLAAIAILVTGVKGLAAPAELQSLGLGTMLTAIAAAVNGLLGVWLIRVGRRSNSVAIEADGQHLLTDVVTSVGVVVGLIIVKVTGWLIVDPILAILLGLNILFAGWRLLRKSASRLMDAADEDQLDEIVDTLITHRKPGDLQPHQLRSRRQGDRLHVDFHIFMPRWWDLTEVHTRVDEIEDALAASLGSTLEAIIHVDPCRPSHCSLCAVTDCPVREAPQSGVEPWARETIASSGPHPDFDH